MAKYQNHRKLNVWIKGMSLVQAIYEITKQFPHSEMYALTSQIQRAAVSIPSNIAEGCGRNSDNEFVRFLQFAMGSAYEVDTQIEIAYRNGYITETQKNEIIVQIQEIMKMIFGLRKSLTRFEDKKIEDRKKEDRKERIEKRAACSSSCALYPQSSDYPPSDPLSSNL